MSDFEQVPFSDFSAIEFAENPENRCPCILLLDVSGSMSAGMFSTKGPIDDLNEGVRLFKSELEKDSLAAKRVEISIVTFGGDVKIAQEFSTVDEFHPYDFKATGLTPMGEAIETAIGLLRDRKSQYQANGIKYYRPWIFMITDGGPNDDVTRAMELIRNGEAAKEFAFFGIGVKDADMNILKELSVRAPLKLQGVKFNELFSWLSSSLSSVSRSRPGESVALPSPEGWAEI
ncbi:VWA domain-containing protein [Acetobacteraceae bacterium]|nr:VWA domain-containing protein [Acetobacteraceae bacterium]